MYTYTTLLLYIEYLDHKTFLKTQGNSTVSLKLIKIN